MYFFAALPNLTYNVNEARKTEFGEMSDYCLKR